MIEHHVMANPRNAKMVCIHMASRRQADDFGVAGNMLCGWTDDPWIKRVMAGVDPSQVSYYS